MINFKKIEIDIDLLTQAVEKWSKIAFEGAEDHGCDDCPCCNHYKKHYSNRCGQCPIRVFSGKDSCNNTPYIDFSRAASESFKPVARLSELARIELDFLIYLRRLLEDIRDGIELSNNIERSFSKKYEIEGK